MFQERNIIPETQRQNERLKPGHKLLLAGPAFLASFAFTEKVNKTLVARKKFNEMAFTSLLTEYVSIHDLLSELVGKENIVVTETALTFGKETSNGIVWKNIQLPTERFGLCSVNIPFLTEHYRSWPRDAYSLINEKILINKDAWTISDENIKISNLGEEGKVLSKGKSILVTPDIWKKSQEEIQKLTQEGYRIGMLPFVDPTKQKYDFKETHFDGHTSLIKDKNDNLALVVADSYSRQGNDARKLIRRGCETIGAKMVEVDDRQLPPLAFNFLQFEDKSIAMTISEARDLKLTLGNLVGNDKVFTTELPLIYIPKLTVGSIRCLTNIIPSWILTKYNSI
jgi:hypothetical protein